MTSPEDIVYGEGHHLPGLEALEGFDFRANLFPESREVAALPKHPDSVVRLEREVFSPDGHPLSRAGYYNFARLGMAHFDILGRFGLQIPAQRFVVGESVADPEHYNPLRLYAFTERVDGRALTAMPEDGKIAAPVVDSLSHYFAYVVEERDLFKRFMFDLCQPNQYTVPNSQKAILHDVGLEFSSGNKHGDKLLCSSVGHLATWASTADMPRRRTRSLRKLVRSVTNKYGKDALNDNL